jgi:hypothetical protein
MSPDTPTGLSPEIERLALPAFNWRPSSKAPVIIQSESVFLSPLGIKRIKKLKNKKQPKYWSRPSTAPIFCGEPM